MSRTARISGIGVLALALLSPSLARSDEYDDAPSTPAPPLPPPAPAAAPAPHVVTAETVDTLHTRSGSVYRGRVVEIVPGSHVTIAVEGADTKRIPWSDTEKVIVASQNLPPGVTKYPNVVPYVPPATAPLAAPMVGPRARVHIQGKKPVILYRRPAGTTSWSQACTAPCDVELPIGDTYRLTGNGVPQSKEFQLDAQPGGTVEISYDPPSTAGMVIGGTLAYGGGLTAYVGLLVALVGSSGSRSYSTSRSSDDNDTRNAGLVTMAVGAGLGVIGLITFLNSTSTDIEQRSGRGSNEAAGAKPSRDAFVRQPSWAGLASSAESAARGNHAPAATFPLVFSTTF